MCSVKLGPGREAIVESALRLFGERGVAATSLREVAKAAGVSPALVVHHFGGKDGLVAAVDETAMRVFAAAYEEGEPVEGPALLRRRAAQTARVMRERPEVCAYVGRTLAEATPAGVERFRAMIAGGRAEIESMAGRGALREDADLLWATLQHFFLIWAPLAFLPLLDGVFDGSLLEPENLERWVEVNVRLLEGGLYRDA